MNEFLPFGTGGGANVVNQATFDAAAWRLAGFSAGVAESNQLNKVWRQSSAMAAALGKIVDDAGGDALDDGDIDALAAALLIAIQGGSWQTGDIKWTAKSVADAGWVLLNDGTLSKGGSGGTTRANDDTEDLYTLLWNNFSDANCPVSTGRGVSAAADFAAGKTIRLPLMKGRTLGVSGAGAGLTARAMGDSVGEETHVLTEAEMPSHVHAIHHGNGDTPAGGFFNPDNEDFGTYNSESAGGDDPHNNMQPTTFMQAMIKL